MSTPNVDLLRETLAHIEANPDQWDQTEWRVVDLDHDICGTACCFAGWAAQLNGSEWDVSSDRVDEYDYNDEILATVDDGIPVASAARVALGLTEDEADYLFAGNNTLDDLRRIVAELTEDAGR